MARNLAIDSYRAGSSRRAIVPAVAAPSMTWWSEFNDKLSTAISRATSLPVPGLAVVQ